MPEDHRSDRSRAGHVMTTDVATAKPEDSFRRVVEVLRRRGVSALPVVDAEGHVLGVVSESDLLLKEANAGLVKDPLAPAPTPEEAAKLAAVTAKELMTSPAMTAAYDTPLASVAHAMHRYGVNRFPVVDDEGKLIGIVSRHDVLTVFDRDDDDILRAVRDMIDGDPAVEPGMKVDVHDGVVKLDGKVATDVAADRLTQLTQSVEGVVGVEASLTAVAPGPRG